MTKVLSINSEILLANNKFTSHLIGFIYHFYQQQEVKAKHPIFLTTDRTIAVTFQKLREGYSTTWGVAGSCLTYAADTLVNLAVPVIIVHHSNENTLKQILALEQEIIQLAKESDNEQTYQQRLLELEQHYLDQIETEDSQDSAVNHQEGLFPRLEEIKNETEASSLIHIDHVPHLMQVSEIPILLLDAQNPQLFIEAIHTHGLLKVDPIFEMIDRLDKYLGIYGYHFPHMQKLSYSMSFGLWANPSKEQRIIAIKKELDLDLYPIKILIDILTATISSLNKLITRLPYSDQGREVKQAIQKLLGANINTGSGLYHAVDKLKILKQDYRCSLDDWHSTIINIATEIQYFGLLLSTVSSSIRNKCISSLQNLKNYPIIWKHMEIHEPNDASSSASSVSIDERPETIIFSLDYDNTLDRCGINQELLAIVGHVHQKQKVIVVITTARGFDTTLSHMKNSYSSPGGVASCAISYAIKFFECYGIEVVVNTPLEVVTPAQRLGQFYQKEIRRLEQHIIQLARNSPTEEAFKDAVNKMQKTKGNTRKFNNACANQKTYMRNSVCKGYAVNSKNPQFEFIINCLIEEKKINPVQERVTFVHVDDLARIIYDTEIYFYTYKRVKIIPVHIGTDSYSNDIQYLMKVVKLPYAEIFSFVKKAFDKLEADISLNRSEKIFLADTFALCRLIFDDEILSREIYPVKALFQHKNLGLNILLQNFMECFQKITSLYGEMDQNIIAQFEELSGSLIIPNQNQIGLHKILSGIFLAMTRFHLEIDSHLEEIQNVIRIVFNGISDDRGNLRPLVLAIFEPFTQYPQIAKLFEELLALNHPLSKGCSETLFFEPMPSNNNDKHPTQPHFSKVSEEDTVDKVIRNFKDLFI